MHCESATLPSVNRGRRLASCAFSARFSSRWKTTREELARRLWPKGTFVDLEYTFHAAVRRLRTALGDDANNPRFVETVLARRY